MVEADRKLTTTKNDETQAFQSFRIIKDSTSTEEALHVVFLDGAKFGILDESNSEALNALVHRPELEIDGQAERNAIRTVISRSQKASHAVIRINIKINGPANLSEEVGSSLSAYKVWLQRPSATKFPYRNPQTIVFPGIEIDDVQASFSRAAPSVKEKKQSIEDFQKTIADVYDTLKRDKDLNRIEGDIRLKTKLLG